jgi:hypothetical protein
MDRREFLNRATGTLLMGMLAGIRPLAAKALQGDASSQQDQAPTHHDHKAADNPKQQKGENSTKQSGSAKPNKSAKRTDSPGVNGGGNPTKRSDTERRKADGNPASSPKTKKGEDSSRQPDVEKDKGSATTGGDKGTSGRSYGAFYRCPNCGSLVWVPEGRSYFICPNCFGLNKV